MMEDKIEFYKVGGAIRDEILGIPSKDIDYAVEAPSFDAMRAAIIERGGHIFLESPQYLTIRARVGKEAADFVLCRKDGEYTDGRRPDEVIPGTIDDDLARRDFTMNAMARGPDGILYDPFHGRQDINDKVIRCVGWAKDRFREDSLRMLRAIRFGITKGMTMDWDIWECLKDEEMCQMLDSVSTDRIKDELNRMFAHDTPVTLQALADLPLMRKAIFDRPDLTLKATMEER